MERWKNSWTFDGNPRNSAEFYFKFFNPQFGYDDFIRIAAWMPYVIELDFEGQKLILVVEHGYADAATLPHRLNYCLPECP